MYRQPFKSNANSESTLVGEIQSQTDRKPLMDVTVDYILNNITYSTSTDQIGNFSIVSDFRGVHSITLNLRCRSYQDV